MKKKQPPSGSKSELYGDLLEDLGPASGLSSWVDIPLDFFRSHDLPRRQSTREVVSGDVPCAARTES